MNGVTYVAFGELSGMDFYKSGPTFIVPTGMNIRVFTEQYDGWQQNLSGNEYWNYNEC